MADARLRLKEGIHNALLESHAQVSAVETDQLPAFQVLTPDNDGDTERIMAQMFLQHARAQNEVRNWRRALQLGRLQEIARLIEQGEDMHDDERLCRDIIQLCDDKQNALDNWAASIQRSIDELRQEQIRQGREPSP